MTSPTLALRLAGTIFGLMSVGQLIRLITQTDIAIAGYHLPLWPSALAALLAGSLCFWLWQVSFETRKQSIGQ